MAPLFTSSGLDSENAVQDRNGCLYKCNYSDGVPKPRKKAVVRSCEEPGMEEIDSLLAKTLNQLSMEERNHALQDLHGVADLLEEEPEFIKARLQEFGVELEKIKSKKTYYIAKSISSNYVSNTKFRLQFLRADYFDAKNAAKRMVRFFDSKLEIFGREKLTQDITLRDLPGQDIEHFKKGYLHLLHQRDRAGRAIVCTIGAIAVTIPVETRRRILWYLWSAAIEEEETQIKGAVIIFYGIRHRQYFLDRGTKIASLMLSFPIRISAIHCCYDDPMIHPLLTAASFVLERNQLCRLRFHFGSHMECLYNLMTFGIPKEVLPFDEEGNPADSSQHIHTWLATRLAEEATTPVANRVVAPSTYDVLMGRGKRVLESPGNYRFRHLLDTNRSRYESVSKFEKTIVAEFILKHIKESGGRFLKQGDSGWTEVDNNMARKKISHAFRNLRSSS